MVGKGIIEVKGLLDTKWQDWVERMGICCEEFIIKLAGTAQDESHLHGILNRIRDLNLKLLLVHPITSITLKNTQNES